MQRRSRIFGLTLIEMLIALTLLSLLSAGILATFRLGQQTYTKLAADRHGDVDVLRAHGFLRQTLESTYPFATGAGQTRFGLEGRADSIEFTAASPEAVGAGHYRYAIGLEPRTDGFFDLVVRSDVDRHGFSSPRSAALRAELLVERIAGARWEYRAAGAAGNGGAVPAWQSYWSQVSAPGLVRLEVTFPADDSRIWPELLVAPRITVDAQCQFDVVSQTCREGT